MVVELGVVSMVSFLSDAPCVVMAGVSKPKRRFQTVSALVEDPRAGPPLSRADVEFEHTGPSARDGYGFVRTFNDDLIQDTRAYQTRAARSDVIDGPDGIGGLGVETAALVVGRRSPRHDGVDRDDPLFDPGRRLGRR